MVELRQEEHHPADSSKVVTWIRGYCCIDPPQTEDDFVCGMKVMRKITHFTQTTSVLLLIGETSEDILKDLDKTILSPQSSLKM